MYYKTTKLIISLLLISLFSQVYLFAQDQSWSKVMNINLKNIGPISENDEVKGYYMFYEVEKKDRKTKRYLLQFLDHNLNSIAKKYITGSNYLNLVEGHYNGENILLKFVDPKKKELTYRQYNASAELVSKKTKEYNPKLSMYAKNGNGADSDFSSKVSPIPNLGFANVEMVKNKKWGYKINFFSNKKGKKGWTYQSNPKSKEVEFGGIVWASEELILASVTKKPNIMSKKITKYMVGIDPKTGEEKFKNKIEDDKYNTMFVGHYLDKETDELTLFGYYYDKSDNVGSNKTKGLCVYTLDAAGTFTSQTHLGWTSDIQKHLSVNAKGRLKEVGYMYFQNIFKTSDGRLFAVAEQYKRNLDGLGITANLVSNFLGGESNNSSTKVVIEDIMVFEFNPDFDLTDVTIFDKNKSKQTLLEGSSFTNMELLGHLVKSYGGFDYVFTQQHRDNDVFSFVFNDYDRDEKNWKVKTVTYAEGEYSTDEVSLSSHYKDFILLKGKKGHVMLAEYDEKAKKLNMRLEKINF